MLLSRIVNPNGIIISHLILLHLPSLYRVFHFPSLQYSEMRVRVATEMDFRLHQGTDLVNLSNLKEFRVKEDSSLNIFIDFLPFSFHFFLLFCFLPCFFSFCYVLCLFFIYLIIFWYWKGEFKKQAAECFNIAPEDQRYWVFRRRQNQTIRPRAIKKSDENLTFRTFVYSIWEVCVRARGGEDNNWREVDAIRIANMASRIFDSKILVWTLPKPIFDSLRFSLLKFEIPAEVQLE